jgi:membrane protease YdiL (CAAX protease family)
MLVSNILIMYLSPINQANNEEMVQTMLRKAPILTFISATFTAPFLEEMLFRKSFGDIFTNKKIMVFASGLFFGLLHVIFSLKTPWDLLYIIPYGALGYGFAAAVAKTDNVFSSIFFHMLHNGVLTLSSIILSILIKVLS